MGKFSIGRYRLGRLHGGYVAVWYDNGKRRRYKLEAGTEPEARVELSQFVKQADRLVVKEVGSLQAIFDAYVANRDLNGKCNVNSRSHWVALARQFGQLPVVEKYDERNDEGQRRFLGRTIEISPQDCKAFKDERMAGEFGFRPVKTGTVWTELTFLRTLLSWGQKQHMIDLVPDIERPAKPAPKDRWLTEEEAERLLEAAVMPHVRLFIILGLTTAGRMSAILDLTWERVDFENGTIDPRNPEIAVTNKGRAHVKMNATARAALQEARQGALTGYVIEWSEARVLSIKKGFQAAAERAGLKKVSPHVLRHTAAVWMAKAGIPMSQISQYLGHTSTAVTERVYARYHPDHMKDAAAALDFGSPKSGPRLIDAA